jgi:hypothetical protein
MKIISGLTTYFSHSNYGQHHLKAEMAQEKDKRDIQVGGATRFSTFSTHAKSIARCFNAIERCLTSGTVTFDTKAVSYYMLLFELIAKLSNSLSLCVNIFKRVQIRTSSGFSFTTSTCCSHPLLGAFKHWRDNIPPVLMFSLYLLELQLDFPKFSKIHVCQYFQYLLTFLSSFCIHFSNRHL